MIAVNSAFGAGMPRAVDAHMPARPANSRWEDHMARFSAIRIPSISKTPQQGAGQSHPHGARGHHAGVGGTGFRSGRDAGAAP
jgi:hypothetical protein